MTLSHVLAQCGVLGKFFFAFIASNLEGRLGYDWMKYGLK